MEISGYKVNTVLKCGWTPLMYAASSALPQIVKFLIDNGADPHSHKGKTKNSESKNHKKTLCCLIDCCPGEYYRYKHKFCCNQILLVIKILMKRTKC